MGRTWNRLVYKCPHYNKFGHLETFCFDKLENSKGSKPRTSITTNSLGRKRNLVRKVKPIMLQGSFEVEALTHIKRSCEKQRVYCRVYISFNLKVFDPRCSLMIYITNGD